MNSNALRPLAVVAAILFMAPLTDVRGETAAKPARQTSVSIHGDAFHINGQPTYAGRVWEGKKIEGLLLNSRMVQGIFDDRNPQTRDGWKYPDTGEWDPERNTREFLEAMPAWREHGLLAFTLNLQGGSPQGYSREQPWHNSAIEADGSLRADYLGRLERILDRADELGMVVMLGVFYFGQDERIQDEEAVKRALDNTIDWLFDRGYTHVLLEINNECNVRYDHAILRPERVHELIDRAKQRTRDGRRLLVSTSYGGGTIPKENVVRSADFLLLHGNGVSDPERLAAMVRDTRRVPGYRTMPIVFNEDDHFDFDQPRNNFLAALGEYASWGYFDPGESNYRDGYQCPPVQWGINTERKQAFFTKLREITEPSEESLAHETLDGIYRFLQSRTAQSVSERPHYWNRDLTSAPAYEQSVTSNRERLRERIGAVDPRHPVTALEYLATTAAPAEIAVTEKYTVHAVRWPVVGMIYGEGLLLQPVGEVRARIVALPDADQTPEMLAGLVAGIPVDSQFARRLAENGCQVVIPALIDRRDEFSGNEKVNRFTNQPHREWIHRQAYQLGRHVIGFEVQKVLAAVDWFAHQNTLSAATSSPRIAVAGYGEGGLVAFYSAAIDPRIDAALVSGYFGPREGLAEEPIYRNVWGLLHEFGDAEIASLVAPRALVVEYSPTPRIAGPPDARPGRSGAAPGAITLPALEQVEAEYRRARQLVGETLSSSFELVHGDGSTTIGPGSEPALSQLLGALELPQPVASQPPPTWPAGRPEENDVRQERLVRQMEEEVQRMMERSAFARADFFWQPAWSRAKQLGQPLPAGWETAVAPLRRHFWEEFIGRLPNPSVPPNARTLKTWDEPAWTGQLVVLDVWPEVIAWGYLLLPKDLQPGERRPVVVCQHGIGGTPGSTIDPESGAYRAFAARLAERGFIVFSHYNPNAFPGDQKFRNIQRWANPLKCSIFSVITGQHQRVLEWLSQQPFVDAERIGFYGLSYGGKTAMRVPALLDGYALSICSGDFNEWTRKIVTPLAVTNAPPESQRFSSYMFTREYEIMEFNQGPTFNYAEMAALIAPRPFMVERGHRDLVGSDEWVAFEYATVRRLYADLGIPERTEIEFFDDGHVIHGQGTFRFLHHHLRWPEKRSR
jgi:dienelactone hydrolase